MIRKLRRRYLITNMALLSSTLLVCLAVLFGFLYHSEISSSYSIMQEMIQETQMPGTQQQEEAEPTGYQIAPENMPLSMNALPDCEQSEEQYEFVPEIDHRDHGPQESDNAKTEYQEYYQDYDQERGDHIPDEQVSRNYRDGRSSDFQNDYWQDQNGQQREENDP